MKCVHVYMCTYVGTYIAHMRSNLFQVERVEIVNQKFARVVLRSDQGLEKVCFFTRVFFLLDPSIFIFSLFHHYCAILGALFCGHSVTIYYGGDAYKCVVFRGGFCLVFVDFLCFLFAVDPVRERG